MRLAERQVDKERRALARLALDADVAAVRVDDLLGDEEPEAQPAVLAHRHRAGESLEDPGLLFLRDADAVVGHLDARAQALAADLDLDRLATAVLDGVDHQIREGLFDPQRME